MLNFDFILSSAINSKKILNLFAHVSLFSQFQFSRIFLITMETRKPKPHICDDLGLEETYCDSEEREIGRRAG